MSILSFTYANIYSIIHLLKPLSYKKLETNVVIQIRYKYSRIVLDESGKYRDNGFLFLFICRITLICLEIILVCFLRFLKRPKS